MNVLVKLCNGHTTEIPNMHWHPAFNVHLDSYGDRYFSAGCYVMESSLKKYNHKYNVEHAKMFPDSHLDRSLEDFIKSIECAEMPFEILQDCDSDTPWKCFGITIREVPYGESDLFWKKLA